MTAIYRGETVRVVRIEAYRAYVVWRKKIKRVNKRDLVTTPDLAMPPAASPQRAMLAAIASTDEAGPQ